MRTRRVRTLGVIVSVALLGLGLQVAARADGVTARAVLKDAGGNTVGVVRLSQEEDAVLVRAVAESLPAGFHGFHVHSKGECTPPFTSALGHFNPGGTTHGAHAGDMPVLLVMDDGTAALRFKTDRFDVADLFDTDGSAIIVHALADNYANIPTRYHSHTEDTLGPDSATLATGDAGGRIACGVMEEP
jgi:Cu-Zn family superoxide dismutase